MWKSEFVDIIASDLSIDVIAETVHLRYGNSLLSLLFAKDYEYPVVIVKSATNTVYNDTIDLECRNIKEVKQLPLGSVAAAIPDILKEGQWRGHSYFVEEFVAGEPIQMFLQNSPPWWQDADISNTMLLACRWLLNFQKATQHGSMKMGDFGFREGLSEFRMLFCPDTKEEKVISYLEKGIETFKEQDIFCVASHGDYCTGNIIIRNNTIGVVDWRYYRNAYHPVFDFAMLIFTLLGNQIGGNWKPYWENSEISPELLVIINNMWQVMFQGWKIDREVARLLILLSCMELSLRGYQDTGEVRAMDHVWRKILVWLYDRNDIEKLK